MAAYGRGWAGGAVGERGGRAMLFTGCQTRRPLQALACMQPSELWLYTAHSNGNVKFAVLGSTHLQRLGLPQPRPQAERPQLAGQLDAAGAQRLTHGASQQIVLIHAIPQPVMQDG